MEAFILNIVELALYLSQVLLLIRFFKQTKLLLK